MEDMIRAIEGKLDKLRPVVDNNVFKFKEAINAYEYLNSGNQVKVYIETL